MGNLSSYPSRCLNTRMQPLAAARPLAFMLAMLAALTFHVWHAVDLLRKDR